MATQRLRMRGCETCVTGVGSVHVAVRCEGAETFVFPVFNGIWRCKLYLCLAS
jgi:hypothetical protein